ncbi:MAG TPA: hypothetical protein VMD99_17155 [Terriglobales bacterium]|nr:hypothetical protein [Terriglobales bacterium]
MSPWFTSIPLAAVWVMLRWRGGFRSHSGLSLLGVVVILVLIVLVIEVARGSRDGKSAGTGNEGSPK